MQYSQVLTTLIGLMTLVYLVVVPEATAVSRMPLPDNAPVPVRFAQATRCYRLTFSPAGFAIDDNGRGIESLQLRDSVRRRPWRRDPRDWDKQGDLSSYAKTHAPWDMAGADSIQVVGAWHWFAGYTLRLSVRSDTLTGRAWQWSDVPAIAPGATVRAAPTSCQRP